MAKDGTKKFDPDNPPKFCPKCEEKGIKSKLKMRRLCPDSEKVLLCKHDQVRYNAVIRTLGNLSNISKELC